MSSPTKAERTFVSPSSRIPMRVQLMVGVFGLVACAKSAPSTTDTTASTTKPAQTVSSQAPNTVASNDTSQAVRLVEEFVRRDAAGERLQSSTWFDGVVTEVDEEPGYDSFTAITDYRIVPAGSSGDTTRINVNYTVVGSMQQIIEDDRTTGTKFVSHDTAEVVPFPVVRTAKGWRIVSPQIDQHVRASAILSNTSLPPLDAESRKRLQALGAK